MKINEGLMGRSYWSTTKVAMVVVTLVSLSFFCLLCSSKVEQYIIFLTSKHVAGLKALKKYRVSQKYSGVPVSYKINFHNAIFYKNGKV